MICHTQRPKLSKILKHLNVHQRDKTSRQRVLKEASPSEGAFKLPTMKQLLTVQGKTGSQTM